MRYIVFALLGILSVILSGTVFGVISVAGICIDLLFLCILSILLWEHTAAPVLFAAVFGLLYDVLYSGVLGLNAFAYAAAALILFAVLRKRTNINVMHILAVGIGGYIIKEVLLAVCVAAMGVDFNTGYMLRRYILPGSVITAGLLFPAYYLIGKLYSHSWMLPNNTSDKGDLGDL